MIGIEDKAVHSRALYAALGERMEKTLARLSPPSPSQLRRTRPVLGLDEAFPFSLSSAAATGRSGD